MGILKKFLLEGEYKWWVESEDALNALRDLMGPLIGIIATVGVVYVIVLWVNWIKADGGKRAECFTRIKNAIIGFLITLVVMALFIILLENIEPIAEWIDSIVGEGQGFGDGAGPSGGGTGGSGGNFGGSEIDPNITPSYK